MTLRIGYGEADGQLIQELLEPAGQLPRSQGPGQQLHWTGTLGRAGPEPLTRPAHPRLPDSAPLPAPALIAIATCSSSPLEGIGGERDAGGGAGTSG